MNFKTRLIQALNGSPRLLRVARILYRALVVLPTYSFASMLLGIRGGTPLIPRTSTYFGDGFATTHHVEFLEDSHFMESYRSAWDLVPPPLLGARDSLYIAWRAHIVTWAATQIQTLEGDWVECGVWFGILPRIAFNYAEESMKSRICWLVDSWGDPKTAELNHPEYQTDMYGEVRARFEDQENVRFVRGLVPDALEPIIGRKIAFLGIDMNGSVAERAALDLLYAQVVPGGIIYFDDYGWDYPKLRETVNEFFSDKPEQLLHFPSGNSIVVKH